MMKSLFFAAAAVMLVVIISGCTTHEPVQIIKDSVAKLDALDSYQAEYAYTIYMESIIDMDGNIKVWKKGESMRSDMEIPYMMGVMVTASNYYIPQGTYSCSMLMEEIVCLEGAAEDGIMPDTEEVLNSIISLVENQIVEVRFNSVSSIAGRDCYNITVDVDVEKLPEADDEDLAAMGLNSSMAVELEKLKSLKVTACYDTGTGMSLNNEMRMVVESDDLSGMPGDMEMYIILNAESYEPNKEIPDSVFELPAEPISEEDYYEQLYDDLYGSDWNESGWNESLGL